MKDILLDKKIVNILLVQPNFPQNKRSRNHHDFLPIGLLKLASLFRKYDKTVKLIHIDDLATDFVPDLICVTSLFTYYSNIVKETVQLLKQTFEAPVIVGGIYASLLPDHCLNHTGCDKVITGIIEEAEELEPAYDLVDVNYQIIHTTRGCIRQCGFCGVYTIEPKFTYKKTIKHEINKKRVIIYDNNFLANPYIEDILDELIELKRNHKIKYIESQSGFDGRLILKNPKLAMKISQAGFKNVKIAWDGAVNQFPQIKKIVELLISNGYTPRTLSCFMLINFDITFKDCEIKRFLLYTLGVQIIPCRYRPLNSTNDGYNSHKKNQTNNEYYIHYNWNDEQVRTFNRYIRKHNLCVRYDLPFHSGNIEKKKVSSDKVKYYLSLPRDDIKYILDDVWYPDELHLEVA